MQYKTINVIIPYFGNFPNYFQLFLNSCERNPTIDWTIITDNNVAYNYPKNVKKLTMSFERVSRLIKSKFDFDAQIEQPYKLCDYRPAYGYIFDDVVKGYDFWGHGDLDVIYGDVRKFLSDESLSCDKIFTLGHLSLYRNSDQINKLFMNPICGELLYRKVFSSNLPFNFDEDFLNRKNINNAFYEYGLSVWKKSYAADIYTKSTNMLTISTNDIIDNNKSSFFLWNQGSIVRYFKENGIMHKKEYMYIHLQKRKMRIRPLSRRDLFKIIPNSIEPLEVDEDSINKDFDIIIKKRWNNQYLRVRTSNLKTKIKKFLKQR